MNKRSVMLPVSLCLLDMAMTLCGQSSHYWNGEFRDVTEASPVFAYFLSIHPGLFVTAAFAWIGVFVLLVWMLPSKLGRMVATAVALGHLIGALGWSVRILQGVVWDMRISSQNSPTSAAYFVLIVLISLVAIAHVQLHRIETKDPSISMSKRRSR